jgi:hypothetical protein
MAHFMAYFWSFVIVWVIGLACGVLLGGRIVSGKWLVFKKD